mgnify:FL=1
MPDFGEMMRRSPTIKEFYFEWEGLRVFGAIDITDVRNELRYGLPHHTRLKKRRYARIPIHDATPESSILVYSEYPVGLRGLMDVKQWDAG